MGGLLAGSGPTSFCSTSIECPQTFPRAAAGVRT
jgi:hypothetical protein